mmetsp:Transcript_73710/g.191452  ORF Transcript_73710/g.191452 Transcript_73710/m.191452 type:complete len:200 (-) Transcript_73710:361-960(-)
MLLDLGSPTCSARPPCRSAVAGQRQWTSGVRTCHASLPMSPTAPGKLCPQRRLQRNRPQPRRRLASATAPGKCCPQRRLQGNRPRPHRRLASAAATVAVAAATAAEALAEGHAGDCRPARTPLAGRRRWPTPAGVARGASHGRTAAMPTPALALVKAAVELDPELKVVAIVAAPVLEVCGWLVLAWLAPFCRQRQHRCP